MSDRPSRVLLVSPQSFFTASGTPFNVLQMCRSLSALGLTVDLSVFPGGQDVPLPPGVRLHRCAGGGMGPAPVGFSWRKLMFDGFLALTVLRLLLTRRPAVVHAVEEAAFFAVPLGRLLGCRTVADLDSDLAGQLAAHRSPAVRRLAGPAAALRRWTLRLATRVLTVAPALTRLARAECPGTAVAEIADTPIAPAARPPDPARLLRLRVALPPGIGRWVVYTGNLDGRQGVEMLVEAFARMAPRCLDAGLLVAGGEPDQVARIEALGARLGVADRLLCLGKRPPEEMPEIMALAAVLASPRLEPLVTPLKLYSYMASGRPILATDLPTHTDVLDAGTAVLAPADAEGFAAGLLDALMRPDAEALGEAARRRVQERYGTERFDRQMAQLYGSLLSRAAAPSLVGPGPSAA